MICYNVKMKLIKMMKEMKRKKTKKTKITVNLNYCNHWPDKTFAGKLNFAEPSSFVTFPGDEELSMNDLLPLLLQPLRQPLQLKLWWLRMTPKRKKTNKMEWLVMKMLILMESLVHSS